MVVFLSTTRCVHLRLRLLEYLQQTGYAQTKPESRSSTHDDTKPSPEVAMRAHSYLPPAACTACCTSCLSCLGKPLTQIVNPSAQRLDEAVSIARLGVLKMATLRSGSGSCEAVLDKTRLRQACDLPTLFSSKPIKLLL